MRLGQFWDVGRHLSAFDVGQALQQFGKIGVEEALLD